MQHLIETLPQILVAHCHGVMENYLSFPGVPGRLHTAHAQQLEDEELAHLADVVAVRGEGDVLVPVRQPARPRHGWPAAAMGVVRPHDLPRSLRPAHHHHRHGAQAQQHDRHSLTFTCRCLRLTVQDEDHLDRIYEVLFTQAQMSMASSGLHATCATPLLTPSSASAAYIHPRR